MNYSPVCTITEHFRLLHTCDKISLPVSQNPSTSVPTTTTAPGSSCSISLPVFPEHENPSYCDYCRPGSSCLRTFATLCRTSAAWCLNWRCSASSRWASSARSACCRLARMAWLKNAEGEKVKWTYYSWQLHFFGQLFLLWADASVPQIWSYLHTI